MTPTARTLAALRAEGWTAEVHGWRKLKLKRGGKAIRWQCRIVNMTERARR